MSHLLAAYAKDSNIGARELNQGIFSAPKVVREKIKPEYHTNCRGELPVHRAAANGNTVTGFFPRRKKGFPPQINEVDFGGRSVLFHAACGGNETNIQELVRMGASLELVDHEGRGPLHAAVMANQPRAVKLLLELGAYPYTVTKSFGLTPLHFACIYGSHECIKPLLDSLFEGDHLTTANKNKWSVGGPHFQPIHLAVSNGHVECTRELLSAGSDSNKRCNNYVRVKKPLRGPLDETEVVVLPSPMSPFELAVFVGNSTIASMISSHST